MPVYLKNAKKMKRTKLWDLFSGVKTCLKTIISSPEMQNAKCKHVYMLNSLFHQHMCTCIFILKNIIFIRPSRSSYGISLHCGASIIVSCWNISDFPISFCFIFSMFNQLKFSPRYLHEKGATRTIADLYQRSNLITETVTERHQDRLFTFSKQ